MDDNPNAVELLMQKAFDYGKTGFDLAKLKAVEKVTDVASTLIPRSVSLILLTIFIFFLSLGLAFWIGDILGKTYLGLLVVAGFYGLCGFVVHFLLHKWFKRTVGNYFVKMLLN